MKAITKKILLASVAVGVLNPLTFGVVYADSSNNEVTVTDDDYTINGETTNFSAEIGDVVGGIDDDEAEFENNDIIGGISSVDYDSNNNTVNIQGGKYSSRSGIWGGDSFANANGNTVNIKSGVKVGIAIFGGIGETGANNNTVNIESGVTFGDYDIGQIIVGGSAYYEGHSAGNNVVNTTGTSIKGLLAGGVGFDMADAYSNLVNINDGSTISGNIVGGLGKTASNNVINVRGDVNLNDANLYGGISFNLNGDDYQYYDEDNADAANFFEYGTTLSNSSNVGNTLNIYTKNLTALNISDFQIINFYLPESTVNGDTILTLTEDSTDISGAQVNAGVSGNSNLNTGDTVTLLTNAGTITTDGTTYGTLTEGVSLTYDMRIQKLDDNKIIATIGEVIGDNPDHHGEELNSKTAILSILPPVIMDIPVIPEYGTFDNFDLNYDDKKQSGIETAIESRGWEIFADVGGGSMKYKTGNGSYVDTKSHNIDLGFARNIGNMANKMTIAPIIDYQNTDYDSYLNDGTHGKGTSKYIGGGVVLRNMNRNGFYYEGSFRAGKNKTDFASDDLNSSTVTYDTSATVLNGHLKLGKNFRLNQNNLLDVYGFYYHTHQGSFSADLSTKDHYNFSSANSGRARLGYRLTTRTSKISQVYTGLAYQFEHNGGVTASHKGYSTSGSSHNGSSGMLEIGWIVKPLKENPWAVNLNATGWVGNQRGVKAMAKVQKAF